MRRRRQDEQLGHRGRKDDPLHRARRLLRRGAATLSDRQWNRLERTFALGDSSGQLAQA